MTYIDFRKQSKDWANKLGNQSVEEQPLGNIDPVEHAENMFHDNDQASLLTPPLRAQMVSLRIRRNYITVTYIRLKLKKAG